VDEYKEHLRRLAVHDDVFVDEILSGARSVLDPKALAHVRLAATIAVDAASSTYQQAVCAALAAGATHDEIVATIEALARVTGVGGSSRPLRGSHLPSATTSRRPSRSDALR
jgi:4-carboxymuconolactone decarboxylase